MLRQVGRRQWRPWRDSTSMMTSLNVTLNVRGCQEARPGKIGIPDRRNDAFFCQTQANGRSYTRPNARMRVSGHALTNVQALIHPSSYRTVSSTEDGKREKPQSELVLPQQYTEQVLRLAHYAPSAGHLGRKKMLTRIQ